MINKIDGPSIYGQLLIASQKSSGNTLAHQVEHAGYGAILSRLMTGLNISLALESNYFFQINSFYNIEDLFEIEVKQSFEKASKNQITAWDFFRDTWNAAPQIRAGHQYPICPIDNIHDELTRHQWCAILAHAICGSPKPLLSDAIQAFKKKSEWNSYDVLIGLHVRRGDKNTECPYIQTECYLYFLDQVASQNAGKKIGVFLATDDPSCVNDIKGRINPNISIIWDADEVRYNNYNAQMVANSPDLALQESLTAAKNICLLGECDYVIGMATAQFTWIGGLLSVYRHQLDADRHIMIDPFTGLRGHWATTYGFEYGSANE
jgi:hypothetical protein